MLTGLRKKREGTFKLLTLRQIAAKFGVDEGKAEHVSPGINVEMRKFLGQEVTIDKRRDGYIIKFTLVESGLPIEGYKWHEEWFEAVPSRAEAAAESTQLDLSQPKLRVSLENGAISFDIDRKMVREASEKGVFILDLADHLEDVQSVPDWYLLSELCVTNFGEAPERRFLYVPEAALSNVP